MSLKQEVLNLLKQKNNAISNKIIEEIDFFDEQELYELKIFLGDLPSEKLKEAWKYKTDQFMATIDKINNIWFQLKKIEKDLILREEKKELSEIILIENSLNEIF